MGEFKIPSYFLFIPKFTFGTKDCNTLFLNLEISE